jgi:hypothetical protein
MPSVDQVEHVGKLSASLSKNSSQDGAATPSAPAGASSGGLTDSRIVGAAIGPSRSTDFASVNKLQPSTSQGSLRCSSRSLLNRFRPTVARRWTWRKCSAASSCRTPAPARAFRPSDNSDSLKATVRYRAHVQRPDLLALLWPAYRGRCRSNRWLRCPLSLIFDDLSTLY